MRPFPFHTTPLRDVDAGERALRFRAFTWTALGGLTGAMAVPFAVSRGNPDAGFLVLLLAGVVGYVGTVAGMYALTMWWLGGAASIMDALVFPGTSAPHVVEYSLAESLVIRGQPERAAEVYEAACLEDPANPEPRARLGRVLRDQLNRPEEALEWLRAARDLCPERSGRDVLLTHEIVELLARRLEEPRRALPELARAAERWKGTRDGEWAAAELARLKRLVHGETADA